MASPLTDAVISSISHSLNPEAKGVNEYLNSAVEKLRRENDAEKLELIMRVHKLKAGLDSSKPSDAATIDALEKMEKRWASS